MGSRRKANSLTTQVEDLETDAAVVLYGPALKCSSLICKQLSTGALILLTLASTITAEAKSLVERHTLTRLHGIKHIGELIERSLRQLRSKPKEFLALDTQSH